MGLFGRWYLAAIAAVIALIFASAEYGNAQMEGREPLAGLRGLNCAVYLGDIAH